MYVNASVKCNSYQLAQSIVMYRRVLENLNINEHIKHEWTLNKNMTFGRDTCSERRIESYMGGGVIQVCPTRPRIGPQPHPAGMFVGVEPG